MTRLLCTGDWQLGKGGRLDDQAAVAERIADLALDRAVDGVLHAGDVFDGPIVQPEELAVFRHFAATLREARVPLLVTLGNGSHDQARRPVDALEIFADAGVQVAARPDVHVIGDTAIACLPWVHPGHLIARSNGDVSRQEVNEQAGLMLARIVEGLAGDAVAARPAGRHVLLGHWHVDAAVSAQGQRVSEIFNEPLLRLEDLEAERFDAVVLGHNHRGQTLATDDPMAPIFHVGSPLAHDFGEAGFDHGVWLLEVGENTAAEFVEVESRRLVQLDHDAERAGLVLDPSAIDGAIVKVRVRGTRQQLRRTELPLIRAAVLDSGAHTVKIETETIREDRARVQGVTDDLSPLDAYDAWAAANTVDENLAGRAREQMAADLEAVGA